MSEAEKLDNNKSGIELLLDRNLNSYPNLPMLEVVFDRYVRSASSSLRSFTSNSVDVEIEKTQNTKFGEYIDSFATPSMMAVVKAIEWDGFMLVVMENQLIYSFVEVLFGGRKTQNSLKVEGRPYTSIEQSIIHSLIELLLNDLSSSFDVVTPVNFQLDRLESNPKFAAISREGDGVMTLTLNITMDSRGGKVDFIFPYSTLEPVKKTLSRSFLAEKGNKDPSWVRHFEKEISNAKITVEGILNGTTSTMGEMLKLSIGQTIILNKIADDALDMKVSGIKCGKGILGKVNGKIALQLTEEVNFKKGKV